MKLSSNIPSRQRLAGMMLIECLVYIAVFAILLGIGTAAFYFCWDHTRAVISDTEDIASALKAGEGWRADVRGATGTISVEPTTNGELVRIPEAKHEIIYRFEAGAIHREIPALKISRLVLPDVRASQMLPETRGPVSAWRWELEVKERHKETRLPLRFTFEAAQARP